MMGASEVEGIDDGDWEEWDGKGSFVHHMIAGSAAGVTEHVSIFPVDTVKTHIQCAKCGKTQAPPLGSAWAQAKSLVMDGGFSRLWRGVGAMFIACIPAHAAYFSIYEWAKVVYGADQPGHHPFRAALAGAMATAAHDAIMTPMDVVKQRLQLGYYRGLVDCVKKVTRNEGVTALYRSYPTTLVMNLPFGMVMVASNESMKRVLCPDGHYTTGTFLLSGASAGAIAGAVTNPLDMIKTRLQTQELRAKSMEPPAAPATASSLLSGANSRRGLSLSVSAAAAVSEGGVCAPREANWAGFQVGAHHTQGANIKYRGAGEAARSIYSEFGWQGFFRGVGPRIVAHSLSMSISWTAYETFKSFLTHWDP